MKAEELILVMALRYALEINCESCINIVSEAIIKKWENLDLNTQRLIQHDIKDKIETSEIVPQTWVPILHEIAN